MEFDTHILAPGIYEVVITKKLRMTVSKDYCISEGELASQALLLGEVASFEIKEKK